MNKTNYKPRLSVSAKLLAPYLILALSLPSPAFALRGQNADSEAVRQEVQAGLEEGKVKKLIKGGAAFAVSAAAIAGSIIGYNQLRTPKANPPAKVAPEIPKPMKLDTEGFIRLFMPRHTPVYPEVPVSEGNRNEFALMKADKGMKRLREYFQTHGKREVKIGVIEGDGFEKGSHGDQITSVIRLFPEGASSVIPLHVVSDEQGRRDEKMAELLRTAPEQGIRVISISSFSVDAQHLVATNQVHEAITYAIDHGVVVIVAAGNNGYVLADGMMYPFVREFNINFIRQIDRRAIVVGNLMANGNPDPLSNSGELVNLWAVGRYRIPNPGEIYKDLRGTSFAAPAVAVLAGFILQINPNFTEREVREIIFRSTRLVGDENLAAVDFSAAIEAAIRRSSNAGLEEIKFYDGFTEPATGVVASGLEELVRKKLVQPGERRVVVRLTAAADHGVTRVFIRADLPQKQITGVKVIQFPVEAANAVVFFGQQRIRDTDLIILPSTVAPGDEISWRPFGYKTPILVTSAEVFDEANSVDLALLALIAENLAGQVYRVGLEEWSSRIIDRDEHLSIQY